MEKLSSYQKDGAGVQAKAVLAFLQNTSGIEDSWNDGRNCYTATPNIARWENCREQGYVISMQCANNQINIAFFEHRNSDSICAVMWNQYSINSITIETAEFGDVYQTKFDVSFEVGYGKVVEMADWIWENLELFWSNNNKNKGD